MKIVGATEYALVLYRGKAPEVRNLGEDGKPHMIFNWLTGSGMAGNIRNPSFPETDLRAETTDRDLTDEGDVVIDPCAGSGSTLRAARELGRNSYGFEVSRDFYPESK